MRIKPCYGCPARDGCDLREEFRRRASGIGAASVSFRCSRLSEALRPGRRIEITTPVLREGRFSDGDRIVREPVVATIVGSDNLGRFSCVVDPGQIDPDSSSDPEKVNLYRFRRRAPHTRIRRFLDEPDARLCGGGYVLRDGGCDNLDGCDICALGNAAHDPAIRIAVARQRGRHEH